ncbi:MAG: hypothetical protein M1826_001342 [Phylliscum demangeonii]|nr:MAG: hypothetical protein M1826_001342 [Phylliscum demangeonii]
MSLSADGTVLSFHSSIYGNLTSLNETVPIVCIFPISGQYTFLPRMLYYVLLVLCVVLRKQLWMVGGAIAIVLTYGASAAVHLIALLARFHLAPYPDEDLFSGTNTQHRTPTDVGDIDIHATWLVVTSACIMLTPLLLWSTTIRRLGVRPLLVYWGVLMYAAFVCAVVPMLRGVYPFFIEAQATCQAVPGIAACSSASISGDDFTMTRQWWTDCQCKDKCSLVDAETPYRSSNSLTPLFDTRDGAPLFGVGLAILNSSNLLAMIFIVGRGLLALLDSRWSQRQVRAYLFRRLAGRRPEASDNDNKPSVLRRVRRQTARWLAAGFYLLSGASAVGCLAIFVINILLVESLLAAFPEAEPKRSIDQWAPWVGLALVTLAAVIKRCHAPVADLVRSVARATLASLRRARPRPGPDSDASIADERRRRRASWSHIAYLLLLPLRSCGRRLRAVWTRAHEEQRDFMAFVRDPPAYAAATAADLVERAAGPSPAAAAGDAHPPASSSAPLPRVTFLADAEEGDEAAGGSGGSGGSGSGNRRVAGQTTRGLSTTTAAASPFPCPPLGRYGPGLGTGLGLGTG